jgi:GNAT superfamily N-acetyltransferase
MGQVLWPPSPIEPSPAERDLLAGAERMSLSAARSMAGVFAGSEFEEFENLYVRSHPLPTETLNEARITRLPSDPAGTLERALTYFRSRSPRWRLVCPPEWQSHLVEACQEAGLTPGPGSPEMILSSGTGRFDSGSFDCRRVNDPRSLESFQTTFSLANQLPDTGFWRSKALLEAPEWDLFLAYREGEPVATGLGFTSDQITGVWAIATVPAHRGQGFGTAITWAVVNAGREKGARATHLWATEMGYPVYRKMGFRHVQNKAVWIYQRPGST